jgi:hypothetical protein
MPDFTVEPKLIFPPGFDFNRECQVEREGYLEDVVVQLNERCQYAMCSIEFERLEKEVGEDAKQRRWFAKPGLIVVSRVSPWILTLAVRWIHSQRYFDRLNPLPWREHLSENAEVIFPEGCDLYGADRKGYLEEVTVHLPGYGKVPISLMIPLRLRQEISADALNGRPFLAEPGLIVVAEISREVITNAVHELASTEFFRHLKPL